MRVRVCGPIGAISALTRNRMLVAMFPKDKMSVQELHNAIILAQYFEPGKNEKVMGHFLFARLLSICDTAKADPALERLLR
jgi:hypothetical protein